MASLLPREAITPDNFSPVVNIVTWILLASMVLAVCTKVAMKVVGRRTFNTDDSILVAAMIISVAQSVSFGVQTYNGVGRRFDSLTTSQKARYEKAGYSADILYILSLGISKIAVLVLIWQITPVSQQRRLALGAGSLILAWTVASFFAAVFQCSPPNTWLLLGQQCFDRTSFWTAYAVINIVTEAVLLSIPTYTIWTLHTSGQRKAVAISCFAVRSLVVGAIIAQLVLLAQQRDSKDVTFDSWTYYLSAQFVQSLSVITACVPYIKNVLVGVQSGMFQTGRFGMATLHKSPQRTQGQDSSVSRSGKENTITTSGIHSHRSPDRVSHDVVANGTRQTNPFSGENTATAEPVTPIEEWDVDSQSSRANIIRETREWHVGYEA